MLPLHGVWVRSLVREQRSHMPGSVAHTPPKKEKYVTCILLLEMHILYHDTIYYVPIKFYLLMMKNVYLQE